MIEDIGCIGAVGSPSIPVAAEAETPVEEIRPAVGPGIDNGLDRAMEEVPIVSNA